MDAHLAACLLLGSQKEIAISKFAMQHAKNEQVKQFAQQMIAAHSKDAGELQKFVGPQAMPALEDHATGSSGSASIERQRSTTTTATSTTRTADDQDRSRSTTTTNADRARGGEQARSGADQSSQPEARAGQTARSQRDPTDQGQAGQRQLGQSQSQSTQSQATQSEATRTQTTQRDSTQRDSTQREVPVSASVGSYDHAEMATQRMKIEHQVAQRCLDLMKAELQKYSGEKFDQAYLGQQAGEHVQMIAMLDVYEQHASPELKQLITKAKSEAQDHLRQANELMEQVHQPGGAGQGATRPGATREGTTGQSNPSRRTTNPGANQ
jgi:predicted outer membrane protein